MHLCDFPLADPARRDLALEAQMEEAIRVVELGRTLGVSSTPTLFFANGERMRGGLPAAQLRTMLDESGRTAAAKK